MEATVEIAGTPYVLRSDDTYLESVGPVFEPDMVALFRCFAKGTVLDIGANIGCTALAFSAMASEVHAFEPSPSTFSILADNTATTGNVRRYNIGLGESEGLFELTFSPGNRSGGFVSNHTQASAGHTIESIKIRRLDDVREQAALESVDFIKIDVEGFEGSVLRGAPLTLSRFKPAVALELNHWCLNAFQRTSVPDFLDFLRSIFPKLYAVHAGTYLDLHDPNESYAVMYLHILQMKYATIVGFFDEAQGALFYANYRRGLAD